ncbi:condensation domain-containing protein [Nocardia macrotermitis]|uniref:2-succinylbenzoate--CoA ligase n=1 Tax=Nocardia macrotermitis TaxID=2585198 RepID=A0A7K0DBD4_9NOCA|nr:condensation domain-containing protein [Nocardia macrotermitis]MQY23106.1 2-succinylbenzoate--CoA ligase [Nocardia macrotermitis]
MSEILGFPASFAQQRMWFLHRLDPADPSYHVPLLLRMRGRLDADALAGAFADVIERQEQLRTSFADVDGELQQRIHPRGRFELARHRVEASDAADAELVDRPAVAAILHELIDAPFDLGEPGALRAALLDLGGEDRLLAIVVHHIVVDGFSLKILLGELDAFYQARVANVPVALPDLDIHYADYSEWQHGKADQAALDAEIAHWRELFPQGLAESTVPTDRPRAATRTSSGARHEFDIDATVADAARALARGDGATLYMVLLSAWAATVSRASGGSENVTAATLLANRDNPQIVDLIGLFVNTLPIPVDLTGQPSFRALLSRVRAATMDVFAHQDAPVEQIVPALRRTQDTSEVTFPLLFALQNFADARVRFADLDVVRIDEDERSTRFELELHIWEHPDRLRAALVYSTDLFDAQTVERLGQTFTTMLRSCCAAPDLEFSKLVLPAESVLRRDSDPLRIAAATGSRLDSDRQADVQVGGSTASDNGPTSPAGSARNSSADDSSGPSAAPDQLTSIIEAILSSPGSRSSKSFTPDPASVERYEAVLHEAGMRPGDVVATSGHLHSSEVLTAALATLRRGGVWLPLDPRDSDVALAQEISAADRHYRPQNWFAVGFRTPGVHPLNAPGSGESATTTTLPPVDQTPDLPAILVTTPTGLELLDRATVAAQVRTMREWFPGNGTRSIWLGDAAHAADILWAAIEFGRFSTTSADADVALGSGAELSGFEGTTIAVGESVASPTHTHTVYGDEAHGWYLRIDADATAHSFGELTVRDHFDTVVPHGFRGTIHLDAQPTGLRGTLTGERLRIDLERTDNTVWTGRGPILAARVRDALLTLPQLREAAVLDRTNTDGQRETIAYVSRNTAIDGRAVLRLLDEDVPRALVPSAVVTLPGALPLDTTGRIDTQALQRIPVLDAMETERLTTAATTAGAATATTGKPTAPPLHRLAVPTTAPTATGEGVPGTGPALSDGGPQPEPHWRALGPALTAAATGPGTIRHLRATDDESVSTYAELLARATTLATALLADGSRTGDPLILQSRDTEDFLIGVWACLLAGLVAAPVAAPVDYTAPSPARDRFLRIWQNLEQPIVLAGRDEYDTLSTWHTPDGDPVRAIGIGASSRPGTTTTATPLPELGPDDVALLMFTSGSTGAPKGVELTHGNILRRGESLRTVEDFSGDYVSFNWMPLDHVGGVVMWHLRDVYHGVDQIHAPTDWILADPLRWLDTMDRFRVTSTWAPNFAFGLVSEAVVAAPDRSWELSALRMTLNAGEAIAPAVAAAFLDALTPHGLAADTMVPVWGMSETCSGVVYSPRFRSSTSRADTFAHLGGPIPGCRIRIVDDADRLLATGEVGRLQVSGATVTRGYRSLPQQNSASFDAEGWFDTGDLGRIDELGSLQITGRAKDVVIINGVNYPCHEIEAAVDRLDCTLTSWSAACAVQQGDGEQLIVFFRLAESADAASAVSAIRAAVVATVGVSPAVVLPLPGGAITKTEIGKIQRSSLRERYERGEFASLAADLAVSGVASGDAGTVADHFFDLTWARRQLEADTPADPGTVITIGTLEGAPPEASALDDTATPAQVLTALATALSESPSGTTVTVVTSQAFAVDAPADPLHAACAALIETARAELEQSHIRHIDTTPSITPAQLAHEIASSTGDPVVALRDARFVPRLRRTTTPPDSEPPAPGDFYLVSGGRGGVGTLVTAHLRRRYGLRLLVIGRSPAPADSDAIRHAQLDPKDEAALRQCVESAERDFGRTLDGVIHLAGHFAEHPLAESTVEDFDAALTAKISVAESLMRLGDSRPDLRWIGFSSVNAVFGAAHAGAYAAANAHLDARTGQFRARGHRAQSIAWSTWHGVGLNRTSTLSDLGRANGYRALDPAEALASLDLCLRRDTPNPLVGLDPRGARIAGLLTEPETPAADLVLRLDAASRDQVLGTLGTVRDRFGIPIRIEAATTDAPGENASDTGGLDATIASVFGAALRVGDFGIHDSFFDQGGTSISAIRAHALLEDRLGQHFSLAELYRSPTPYRLAHTLRPVRVVTAAQRVASRAQRRRAARAASR